MFKAMQYIHSLEATGVPRNQAEAQVQLVMDALENDFLTKHDFKAYEQRAEARFERIELRLEAIDKRFDDMDKRFEHADRRFDKMERDLDRRFQAQDRRFQEMEARLVMRLGAVMVTCMTLGFTIMGWMLKLHGT